MKTKTRTFLARSTALMMLVIMLFAAVTPALAADTGAKVPGTAVSTPTSGAGYPWTPSSGNLTASVQTDDDITAWSGIGAVNKSRTLQLTNFGFSMPNASTINGIKVEINRWKNSGYPYGVIQDMNVQLYQDGVLGGNNKAVSGNWSQNTATVATYGGSTDTWGRTWTAAQIKSSAFGLGFQVQNTDGTRAANAYVDYVKITVYYTLPPAYTITSSAGANGSITPAGDTSVYQTESQTYTITPVTGYHVADVLVDGASVGAVPSYTFTNVTAGHTINASFAINTYTLTYNAGANGTVSGTTPQTVNHGGSGTTVTAVANTGYHFVDWSDGVTTAARTETNVTANETVTANFAIDTYTVTFNANGGTGTMTPQVSGVPAALNANTFTRAGYVFTGWNTATDGTGTAYANRATYGFTTDVTLYAQWAPAGNALNFDGTNDYVSLGNPTALSFNGATSFTIEAWIQKSNLTVQSAIVSKMFNGTPYNGYELFSDSGGKIGLIIVNTWSSNAISVVTTSAFNDTNWHHVAVSYNGSRNASGVQIYVDGVLQPLTIGLNSLTGSTVTTSPAYIGVRDGGTANAASRFTGTIDEVRIWNVVRSGTEIQTNMNNAIAPQTGLLVAYYKLDQGTAGGTNTGLTTAIDSSGNILNGTLTNFGLTGTTSNWVYGNVPLTVHTVTFNANGGVGSNTTQTASTATALTANAFTRTGYTFAGWNTVAGGGGTSYTNTQNYNFARDLILYAQWAPNRTVTFYPNGGSGIMSPQVTGVTTPLTLNAFTRTGYTFAGWDTSSAGTSVVYTNGANYPFTANANLYAVWTINQYTISFEENGGSTVANITQNYNTVVTKPTDPTKEGHTFGGWYSDAGLNTAYSFTTMPDANITIYAKWTINTYTVTFDPQNGDATSTQDVDFGDLVTEPTAPVKDGYTFAGWFDAAIGGTQWDFANDTMGAGDMTLYGQWTLNTYTVTFDPQNGEATFTQDVDFGNLVTEPTAPVKDGYTFAGWFDAATGGTQWDFANDTMGAGDMTLYGQWTLNTYAVTFDPQNGDATSTQTVAYGNKVTEPTAPVKDGYTFAGWFNGASVWDFANDAVSGDMTLTAHWTAIDYTVTFDADGGTPTPDAQTVAYGNKVTQPADPAKDGHTFAGWYNGASAWDFTNDTVTGDMTLTAHWTAIDYTVTFNADGGTPIPDAQTVAYGNKVTQPADPAKDGHTFAGWYNGASAWDFTNDTVTGDMTLTAHWTAIDYTVTFNADGGTPTPDAQTVAYGNKVTAPAEPTKDDYTFAGWFNGDLQWDFGINTMGAGDMTLTAHWTALPIYTVKFDADGGTPVPSDQSVVEGNPVTPPATDPAKDGYIFDGWYYDTSAWDFVNNTVSGNMTLTAQWTAIDYTVTYDGSGNEGGTVPTDSSTYNINDTITVLDGGLTRANYTFNGWSDGTNTYQPGDTFPMGSSNVTLTAQWTPIGYNLTIVSAYGTITKSPDKASYTFGEVVTLSVTAKPGWTFIGWSPMLTNNQVTVTGNTTVTAVYVKYITTERAKNGGFEKYVPTTSKKPYSWAIANFNPLYDGKNTSRIAGKYSFKFRGTNTTTKTLSQTIYINGYAGEPLTFSYWWKGTTMPRAGVCEARWILYTTSSGIKTTTFPCPTTAFGWRQVSTTLTPTANYYASVIKFTFKKTSGSIWIDNVSLKK
jgi:uncharacterized repeat protein (TIGR02543 family)